MTTKHYGMSVHTSLTLDEAEARIREALAAEGFGILTEIDVAATLEAKLGIERRPYKILGACNPPLANRALEADESIGLLLPCNVVVYEDADGTVVSAIEPLMMADLSPAVQDIADEAHDALERALQAIPHRLIVEATVDRALDDLAAKKDEWAHLSVARKLAHLETMRRAISARAEQWVGVSLAGKRISDGSPLAGEEWISGPYAVLLLINSLTKSLQAVKDGTDVLAGTSIHTRAGGQVVVEVFPGDIYDRLLLNGYRAEVWMQEGVTPANLRDHVASFYKQENPPGSVGLILGAGNISSIPVLDVLTKMFIEGQVVIVKMNPINDYLGPVFEEICADLIDAGYLRFVYGGGDVGAYLTNHDLIDTLHITGSADTYNKIVFGGGEAGAERRARNEPLITKPFTSELGGVGPTFIVPGPWTDADLAYQAEHLATQKFHNAGFNCIASQVLVLPGDWSGSDRLVDELRRVIRSIPAREAYYPGADERQAAAVAKHPHAELLDAGPIPRTLITDVDAASKDEYAFTTEFFGGVYATTKLDASDPAEFVPAAVAFANQKLAGTLGAQFIIHPKTLERIGPVLDKAIADLNYGTVAVNGWTGAGYLLPTATWGAFPGHTHDDIGSGMGVVHNGYMFDWPEKTVVHAPFHPFPRSLRHGQFHLSPKPPWFVTHRRADKAGERLTRFAADPGWRHLPGIFAGPRCAIDHAAD